ncbi:uncharacterized protein LOC119361108 [Triticum dicoccoides]|uniref:uncharacterized protein LOC119361108 n=1 Tax=Triticum dicoccoides TaxID=85692 RepID=UPI001890749F|nr:uncharacterized protein LOC119361108 [Triticum dicoccoides]
MDQKGKSNVVEEFVQTASGGVRTYKDKEASEHDTASSPLDVLQSQSCCLTCKNDRGNCSTDGTTKRCVEVTLRQTFCKSVNITCDMREAVNSISGNKVVLCTPEGFHYKVNVTKRIDVTSIHGARWNEFLFDYNLLEGDKVLLIVTIYGLLVAAISKENVFKIRSPTAVAQSVEDDVKHIIDDVVMTRGCRLMVDEDDNLVQCIRTYGAFAISSFVHRITQSDMGKMKIPREVADELDVCNEGMTLLVMYKTFNLEIDGTYKKAPPKDGRIVLVTGWKVFCEQAGIMKNKAIMMQFFKRNDDLVIVTTLL